MREELSRDETIRVTALHIVLESSIGKLLSPAALIKDAEKVEKYIRGYETKPEGE